ncbi:hypothetical protein AGMMS49992_13190 [Clostridia bacterium]|nr:hypothetical protein AGMMS49992_13190 [Clostridia bacterium]
MTTSKRFLALVIAALLVLPMFAMGAASADEAPTKITWFWREGGDPQLPEDSYIVQKILKDLNIEYVHVTSVGMTPEEKLTMLLMSGEVPDIIDSYNAKTTELRRYGVIIPLDEYITPERLGNLMNNMYEADTAIELMRRADGHIWAIPATFASVTCPNPYIRYDWLEKLGLEVPTTYDELKDVLIAFTKNDPDGNGVDDTWGTSYAGIYSGIDTNMGGQWNRWYYTEDGIELGLMSDRILPYLEYVRGLIADGAVNPEILDPNELGTGHGDAIVAGKLGFSFGYSSVHQLKEIRLLSPEAEWHPMLPPVGVYDVGYLPADSILRQEYNISRDALKAGKIDKIFELINYMCDDGGDPTNINFDAPYWEVSYGERGVNWDLTPDGLFDFNGALLDYVKANNEGKNYLNGSARRFRTKSMQAAYNLALTPDQQIDQNFMYAEPIIMSLKPQPGALIVAEGLEVPQESIEFERNIDILWGTFSNQAMLGQIDIAAGLEQIQREALAYGYEDVVAIMTEAYTAFGKLPLE